MVKLNSKVGTILLSYRAFNIFKLIDKIGINSVQFQNLSFVLAIVIFIILAAIIDNVLILSNNNIGLLEHPSIWAFIAIQAIVPSALLQSVKNFITIPKWSKLNLPLDFLNKEFVNFLDSFTQVASRSTNWSKFIYGVFISLGLIGFIWNTYQNQMPYRFLGFDFWDSKNHQFCYWITRIYKFYLWVFFFPAIAHLQISILISMRKLLIHLSNNNLLRLEPYHYDQCGGVKQFIDTVLKPMIPILIIMGILTVCVLSVHDKIDVTTVLNIVITILAFFAFYFIPAISLRQVIKNEKKRQLIEISEAQNAIFSNAIIELKEMGRIKSNVDAIMSFNILSDKIKSLPNWPHLKYVLKMVSIAISPSFISILLRNIIPFIKGLQ